MLELVGEKLDTQLYECLQSTIGGSTFIEVRVQAVRLKLRPRPAVRLTLAL